MKRMFVILSIVVAFVLLPRFAKADSVSFVESNGKYISNGEISVGAYGVFKTGDAEYTYTDKGNGIKEWNFYLTAGSDLNYIYLALAPKYLEIQDVESGSDFMLVSEKNETDTYTVLLMANNQSGIKKGEKVLLFTITTKDTSTDGCILNVSPRTLACASVEGYYFNKSGKIVNEENYNKECSNTGTTDEPLEDVPNNSETGIPVPYIALGGGLVAIAGVYFLSKKNSKMFKI